MKEFILKCMRGIGSFCATVWRSIPFTRLKGKASLKWVLFAFSLGLVVLVIMAFILNREPASFDIRKRSSDRLLASGNSNVVGGVTVATLIEVSNILLDKPGGYMSNDLIPPMVFMDNIPSWEWGVLVQVRDLTHSLRNDMSRNRTQSIEVKELAKAENHFIIDNTSWVLPRSEKEYRKGIANLEIYLELLSSQSQVDAQFYARADNLRDWLLLVEKRLGSLSQRLSASVGQARINTDLAGDSAAEQSTFGPLSKKVKTPWLQIDNVFYEARGATWALLHFLQAIEIDFERVLEKKNARAFVHQIIRDLESTQHTIYSPMILNGGGFGIFANHSLVMTSYISRANTAVVELRTLLSQG